ncbi:MAG: type II toxin-antitoxin system PemK/MazF family toxin [Methylobacteriaceae bacterium]|nr:type II toxin-antitoxin system PemK/MazF family toxin [Rhodoblastus sp.]MCC0004398.1 type II toxin-antitoxin system PemK/MazF family toxin [Methylobacteriaceae bacterium]
MTRRGDFVTVATPGDYGKPRPALVVQNDLFDALPSVVILPLTSLLRDDADQIRIDVAPSEDNGLREKSQIAVDKITVVPAVKVGQTIGRADDALMLRVTRAMALFLGIA